MWIEFQDNECSFIAGQYIQGTLYVTETESIMAESIQLALVGFEEITL